MGPRSCLDWCRKSSVLSGIKSPESPAHSEILYPWHEGILREKWYNSTVTSAPDEPSCPGRLNPGTPQNKSLGQECLSGHFGEEKNIWTLDHPDSGIDSKLTMLPWLQNFTPEPATNAWPWPFYSLERNFIPTIQDTGRVPISFWSGVENLVPAVGLNP